MKFSIMIISDKKRCPFYSSMNVSENDHIMNIIGGM